MKIKIYKYKKGGTLLYTKTKNKSSGLLVSFKVGHLDNYLNGISHFLEHSLFLETNKRNHEQLQKDLNETCFINAFTNSNTTNFEFYRTNKLFDKSLELFSDMITNTKFVDSLIEKERDVILEEYNIKITNSKNSPHFNLLKSYTNKKFDERLLIGNKEDLNKINAKILEKFKNVYYNVENMICVVNSSYSFKKIKNKIYNNFIKKLPIGRENSIKYLDINNKGNMILTQNDNEKLDIIFLIKVPKINKNDKIYLKKLYILKLLTSMLNNKLFNKLRDLGYVYSFSVYNINENNSAGICFNFSCSQENLYNIIQAINDEINYIRKNNISEKEFNIEKNNFLYSLDEDYNSPRHINAYILYHYLNSLLDTFKDSTLVKIINSITVQDINEFFNKTFNIENELYVSLNCKFNKIKKPNYKKLKNLLLKE